VIVDIRTPEESLRSVRGIPERPTLERLEKILFGYARKQAIYPPVFSEEEGPVVVNAWTHPMLPNRTIINACSLPTRCERRL